MARLQWDVDGTRFYETGVKHCALYIKSGTTYGNAIAWSGITGITESPSGAEATALYADDMKYLNLYSAEEFGATVEAYTYPDEFMDCDGSASLATGVRVGQQKRKMFGLVYQTTVGTDSGTETRKLHVIYGAMASPSEKSYSTINDSPEAITFSWELSSTPITETVNDVEYRTATVTIDETKVGTTKFESILDYVYGTDGEGSGTGTNGALPTLTKLAELAAEG